MEINQRLFEIIKSKRLSYADISKATGISANTIGDWARKGTNPSAEKIPCICKFLGISCDYLLTGENPPADMMGLSPEAVELARRWDALDPDGQALVRAELVRAEDRAR